MAYRQIRVTINPGKNLTTVAVVARVASARGDSDRLIYRDTLDTDGSTATAGGILLYVSDVLAEAADLL